MNDMKETIEYLPREQKILNILFGEGPMQSSQIHEKLKNHEQEVSLVTVKRTVSALLKKGAVLSSGAGRSVTYELSVQGKLFLDVDSLVYCSVEPDKRKGQKSYDHDLFENIPAHIFAKAEMNLLKDATKRFREKTAVVSKTIQKKELERLVIELSWKSSKIEGNTYTLLETEKLLLENTPAPGHDPDEARMILNHKNAFSYVREHAKTYKKLTRSNIEEVHALLVSELGVSKGLRSKGVGIRGSAYRPLENKYQVEEAVVSLCDAINRMDSPYEKALLVLLGISYIQPFEDGNKRTARILADAILLAYQCAPLSYRSVDETEYRNAMLVFYEVNSLVPFRKLFMTQYLFAAENYTVK